jgi:hypothetical protein
VPVSEQACCLRRSTKQNKATPSHKYKCLERSFFASVITILSLSLFMPARLLSGLAVVLALSGHVFTYPRPENTRHTHLYGSLSSRDSTTSEPDDTVSITKMPAVGDSYSAGIGAGNVLSDNGQSISVFLYTSVAD